MLIPRVLVGPLIAPEQLGEWLFHPHIRALADPRVFHPPPAWRGLLSQTPSGALPWRTYMYGDSLADILAEYADWQPEVILWWGFGYTVLPADLAQAPCPVVLIASDWQSCLSELWAWREAFDLILGDQALVNQFQARGFERCQWWPSYGFSPTQFYPAPQADKVWDLTYIGSLNPDTHPERLRLLSQLAPLGKDFRICLRDQVYGAEHLQILQQSRVVFNHALRGEMNLRAYQAPAAGALLLQESGNLEIVRFLKPGSECLLYQPDSVLADISAILARSDLPDLAAAGQKAILAHSYHTQFERLLADLPKQLALFQRPTGPVFGSNEAHQRRRLRQALHPAFTAGQTAWLKTAFLAPAALPLPASSWACLALSLATHPAESDTLASAWQNLQQAVAQHPSDPLLKHDLAWAAHLTGQPPHQIMTLATEALALLQAGATLPESPETLQVLPWVGAESFQLAWVAACFNGDLPQIRSLLYWNLWRLKAEVAWSERRLPDVFEALEQALGYLGPATLWLPFAQTALALGQVETAWQALDTHLSHYPCDRRALQTGLEWGLKQGKSANAKVYLEQLEQLNRVFVTSESERTGLATLKQAL